MTAPRKRAPPRRPMVQPPERSWETFFAGNPSTKLIAVAAAVTAGLYLLGIFKPVIDSGPLPLPSRIEVEALRKDTTQSLDTVTKGLDATLEVAKAANVAAQNANDQLSIAKLDRLIAQKVQLEALLAMNPQDQTLKQALEHTQIDIGKLAALAQPPAGASALTPK